MDVEIENDNVRIIHNINDTFNNNDSVSFIVITVLVAMGTIIMCIIFKTLYIYINLKFQSDYSPLLNREKENTNHNI